MVPSRCYGTRKLYALMAELEAMREQSEGSESKIIALNEACRLAKRQFFVAREIPRITYLQ
jgi:hypothetical protein